MKISLTLPSYARWFRAEGIWAVCEKAKEIGIDALSCGDHVIFTPTQYVAYGNGYMDIWTTLAYLAAVTNAQGWAPVLATGIAVIPFRPPIQQAKVAATVDSLSGGRLMIGAGSGYNENEFAALGLNIRERGDMTDEYLACMIELWTHPVASFHGKYVNFDEMTISVRPVQQPHPPILYGSSGPRPFRRIAERYQGWIAGGAGGARGMRAVEEGWAEINRLWKEYGRQGKPYLVMGAGGHLTTDRSRAGEAITKGVTRSDQTVTGISGRVDPEKGEERAYVSTFHLNYVDEVVERIRTCADVGADMVTVGLPSYRYEEFDNQGMLLNQMEILAEHVIPKVR